MVKLIVLRRKQMQCPYCNREMKLGTIDVYDTLSWSPEGEARKGPSKYDIMRKTCKSDLNML